MFLPFLCVSNSVNMMAVSTYQNLPIFGMVRPRNPKSKIGNTLIALFVLFSPKAEAQWQPIIPPGTAIVQAIGQHNGHLLAGGAEPYFYRSADGGKTWQVHSSGVDSTTGIPYFPNLRQFVAHGNAMYAIGKFRVFKTEDNGLTWSHVVRHPFVEQLQWQQGQQFAATDTSILLNIGRIVRYRFASQTWEDVFVPDQLDGSCRTLENTPTGIRLITGARIYQTKDGGNTWNIGGQTLKPIDVARSIGDTIVGVTNHTPVSSELHRSFDGGKSWETRVTMRLNYAPFKYFQGKLYALPVSDSTKAWVSNDLGETWTTLITGATPPPIHDLTVLPDGTIVAAEKSGILKSTNNGQHWQYSNAGLPAHSKLEGQNGLLWATAGPVNHFTTDGGRTWQSPFLIDNVGFLSSPVYATTFGGVCRHGGKWYASAPMQVVTPPQGWGLYTSDGDLTRWSFQRVRGIGLLEGLMSAGGFLLTHLPNNCAYAYSDDGGLNFIANTGANNGTCAQITAHKSHIFGLHQTPGTILYIDSSNVNLGFPQFRWDTLRNGLPNAVFTGLAQSASRLAVFSPQKIAISDDAGRTWQEVGGDLPVFGTGIRSVALAGDTLMAVADQRVWLSFGHSGGWTDITGHLPETPVKVASDGKNFVAVGHLNGWYRLDLNNLQAIHLQGLVFVDDNRNGVQDANEDGLSNALVQIGHTGFLTTGPNGQFEYRTFFADSIRVVLPTPYAKVVPSVWYLPAQASIGQAFAVQFQPNIHDLALTLARTAEYRPGFEQKTFATVRNRGSVAASGDVRVFIPKQVDFLSANPVPDLNFGDSVLVWRTGNIPLLGTWRAEMLSKTKTNIPLGILVRDTGFVSLVEKDTLPKDNFFSESSKVVGSFDPNDKLVSPTALSSAALPEQPVLTYTVRFQNTGTTPAIHVRIVDTLAADFDLTSFQLLVASHPVVWHLNGRILECFFENIHLPDRVSDELGSHGFVRFSLRPSRSVGPNKVLRNQAAIYFDFNAPILTGFVELPVRKTIVTRETFLTLCPNQGTYEGIVYPTVGTVTKILSGYWADTLHVVHVNWHPPIPTTRIEAEVCPGDIFFGHVWQTPGNAVVSRTETAANGCDSLIEYQVKINGDFHIVQNQSLKPGESLWGIPCYSDTVLVFPGTTQKGCDSTVTVYVTLINPTQMPEQVLQNLQLAPNPAGDQTHFLFETLEARRISVWLESTDGRTVRQFAAQRYCPPGKNDLPLPLEGLPSGAWRVVVQTNGCPSIRLLLVRGE